MRAGAHGARLERHHERVRVEPPRPGRASRGPQREQLGVSGRVAVAFALVVRAHDDFTCGPFHDNCADRHVAVRHGIARLGERDVHGFADPFTRSRVHVGHAFTRAPRPLAPAAR